MNRTEHLLVCLNEECVEIAHAEDKALRFGLSDGYPATNRTNLGDVIAEINDLTAVIELLVEEGILGQGLGDRSDIAEKKERVLRFTKYAEDNGSIT